MTVDADGLALSDVMRLHTDAKLAGVHVAMPARVLSFDAERNTVDVQPEMDRAIKMLDGSILEESLPVIPSVPVVWPRSGSWAVTFPLAAGDRVLVACTDRNLGEWRRNAASNPRHVATHRLDGAVAIPGLYPLADAVSTDCIPSTGIRVGSLTAAGPYVLVNDDGVQIKHPTSGIQFALVGGFDYAQVDSGGVAEFVAQANKVALELAAIKVTLDSLAGATFGTPYVPNPAGVAASKFKAE